MHTTQEIKEGDIFVATWGYTMLLSTWCRVVKVGKTLLVEEIVARGLSQQEIDEQNLTVGYLQLYSVPTDTAAKHHDKPVQFRLYHRGESWKGAPAHMSYRHLFFKPWDGKPVFEDHCD